MTVLTILFSGEEKVSESILIRKYKINEKNILPKRSRRTGILSSPKKLKSICGDGTVKLSSNSNGSIKFLLSVLIPKDRREYLVLLLVLEYYQILSLL